MEMINLIRISLSDLLPHEEIRQELKIEMERGIEKEGMLKRPIVVYALDVNGSKKYMIIDGHHRSQSLKDLGCRYVMANCLNYFSDSIKALSWDGNGEWDKREIVKSALVGRLLKPKTTKHVIMVKGKEASFQDNDFVEPLINCPIDKLK